MHTPGAHPQGSNMTLSKHIGRIYTWFSPDMANMGHISLSKWPPKHGFLDKYAVAGGRSKSDISSNTA